MNWNDVIEQENRRNEWLRDAEQRRLIVAVRGTRPRPVRFYHPVLVRLGRRLVAWGWSLQARGGGLMEMPSPLVVEAPAGQC
jgi:hypothetical protein